MCPCTAMSRAPKKTSISRSAFFFFFFFLNRWGLADDCERRPILCRDASTPVTTDCAYAIRPSWTPLRRGVNNWRNSPAKSGRLIGCAPGHQVTPRLRALFRAGAPGDSSPSRAFSRRGTRWLLAFTRFSAQGHQVTPRLRALPRSGASGTSSPSRTFSRRGIRWLLAFARFSAQGHQVTPRLRALFRAGAPGDSSPSRVFPRRGIIWLTAALRRGGRCTTGKRVSNWSGGSMSPWMSERAESSTHGSRWCGAGIMWMRVFSTHGRPLSGGWYRVNKRAVPNTAAADEGLVSCEWECPLHTADSCRGAGIVWIREQFQTRQPLMRGWYRVNESVLYTRQTAVGGLVSCE